MQGRGNLDQWVEKVKFATTMNGKIWKNVEEGKIFAANFDCHSKVRIDF